jgi:transcriptional regulator
VFVPDRFAAGLEELDALFARDAFVTLVSSVGGEPFATHIPVLYARYGLRVVLRGHLARANPQWRDLAAQTALVIAHGPHAYISPTWYAQPERSVPTWSYTAAHLYGTVEIVEEEDALRALVADLAAHYEEGLGSAWRFPDSALDTQRSLAGIVGFEFKATHIEVKHKLNQHHDDASLRGAIDGLRRQGGAEALEIAALMEEVLQKRGGGTRE